MFAAFNEFKVATEVHSTNALVGEIPPEVEIFSWFDPVPSFNIEVQKPPTYMIQIQGNR